MRIIGSAAFVVLCLFALTAGVLSRECSARFSPLAGLSWALIGTVLGGWIALGLIAFAVVALVDITSVRLPPRVERFRAHLTWAVPSALYVIAALVTPSGGNYRCVI